MSIFESSDIVLNLLFQLGGVKPQDNGAYAEELQDLPYPYVNKSNGIYIDIMCKEIELELGICYTENELIDYMFNAYNSKNVKSYADEYAEYYRNKR